MKIDKIKVIVQGLEVWLYSVEKEGYVAGGGVALFKNEQDALEYVSRDAMIQEKIIDEFSLIEQIKINSDLIGRIERKDDQLTKAIESLEDLVEWVSELNPNIEGDIDKILNPHRVVIKYAKS